MMTPRRAAVLIALAGLAVLPLVTSPAAGDKALDDLVFEMQLVPLNGQTPPAFELEQLGDGKTVTLAEHRGRPVMLYFWASW